MRNLVTRLIKLGEGMNTSAGFAFASHAISEEEKWSFVNSFQSKVRSSGSNVSQLMYLIKNNNVLIWVSYKFRDSYQIYLVDRSPITMV